MKNNSRYLIFPCIQGGVGFFLLYRQVRLPETMSQIDAICFVIFVVVMLLIPRILCIAISSYIINISKYIFYKINGDTIISICMFPFFVYKSQKTFANIFWIYDDRTCFSMNKYVADSYGYEKLRNKIKNRNRFLTVVYVICSSIIVITLIAFKRYVLSWIFLVGFIEHFFYQSEYKKIGSANAMAFSGLINVDDRLMLHILVNQSKIEALDFGQEVADILSKQMFKEDGEYFFKNLCLSSMFNEIYSKKQNNFSEYIDIIVEGIIENAPEQMRLIETMKKDIRYQNIDDTVCIFYRNYREFLLYVLMYYRINNNVNGFIGLNNYIRYMLEIIERNYIKDTILSEHVLAEKFEEYKNLYLKILNGEFLPETSIFTGYETLPIWKQYREHFIKTYNECGSNRL